MHCDYFDAGQCRSCTLMGTAYTKQLPAKQDRAREALAAAGVLPAWAGALSTSDAADDRSREDIGGTGAT